MGGGGGWGRQSKVFKLILKFLSKHRWCWLMHAPTSRRRWMWQCVCNSPFTGTQNYNLLRHRTSVCGHQKINNVTKFVTTSGNTCRSCLSWFYDGKTVNFGLQNSFFAVFWRRGKFETTEQTSINAQWVTKGDHTGGMFVHLSHLVRNHIRMYRILFFNAKRSWKTREMGCFSGCGVWDGLDVGGGV